MLEEEKYMVIIILLCVVIGSWRIMVDNPDVVQEISQWFIDHTPSK